MFLYSSMHVGKQDPALVDIINVNQYSSIKSIEATFFCFTSPHYHDSSTLAQSITRCEQSAQPTAKPRIDLADIKGSSTQSKLAATANSYFYSISMQEVKYHRTSVRMNPIIQLPYHRHVLLRHPPGQPRRPPRPKRRLIPYFPSRNNRLGRRDHGPHK